jgi:hypothetical protein
MFKKNLEARRSNHLKNPEKHTPNRTINTILKKTPSNQKLTANIPANLFSLQKMAASLCSARALVRAFHFNSYQSIISEDVWSALLAMWEANKL